METIFVKDNINKISESLSSQKIDLNNTAYVDFSFSPKTIKKIVRITKSRGSLQYDGIIYESVQSTDEKLRESLCIAVPPTIADNYLEFDGADLWEFDFENIQTAIVPVKTKSNFITI